MVAIPSWGPPALPTRPMVEVHSFSMKDQLELWRVWNEQFYFTLGPSKERAYSFKTSERIVCPLSSISQCLVWTDAATLTQGALLRLTVGASSLPCSTFQPWWSNSDISVVIPESRAGPLCPLSESQGIFSFAGPSANTILSAPFFKRKKTKL